MSPDDPSAPVDERPSPDEVGAAPVATDPAARVADEAAQEPPAQRDRSRRRRVAVRVGVGALVVLALAGGWLALQVYRAGTALRDAQATVSPLVDRVRAGDVSAVTAALPAVQDDLARARAAAGDPVWTVAQVLPWLGDQLRAVRTVAVALDDMVAAGAPALAALDDLLTVQDAPGTSGGIELSPLIDAAPLVRDAAVTVRSSVAAISAIDTGRLLPQLAGPLAEAQDQLASVSGVLDVGTRAAGLLPGMLGADGPRTYLLASLNSAELRVHGGIVGTIAVLTVDDGVIDLGEQKTTADFAGLEESVVTLTPEERELQTSRLGRWVQNAVLTPDFPRAASILATRWTEDTGQRVDGVIATDVVAVAGLLRATGPVTEPSGVTLTADNLVPELLHNTYLRLTDPIAGDRFYTDVAATIFHAVGDGQGDRRRVVAELVSAVDAGRVRVWSAHDDEQAELAASTIGAAFLTGPYPDTVGVFLDDGTAGKLDYYLTTTLSVEDMVCTGDGPTATVRLDLAYDPPADVASQPRYVTGYPADDLPTGWLATNVSVYAPVGAPLGALGLDDGYVSGRNGSVDGRAVQTVTSWLPPGGRATYRAQVPVRGGSLSVWSTPTLTSGGLLTAACDEQASG